jgi:hypothetical protein
MTQSAATPSDRASYSSHVRTMEGREKNRLPSGERTVRPCSIQCGCHLSIQPNQEPNEVQSP